MIVCDFTSFKLMKEPATPLAVAFDLRNLEAAVRILDQHTHLGLLSDFDSAEFDQVAADDSERAAAPCRWPSGSAW